MTKIIVEDLRNALISASNNLSNHKNRIDALNVFPVPDGDTGSNMSSTISKAAEKLVNSNYETISEMMFDLSRNMLLSARGNSGVILSQIFKGFYEAWKNSKKDLDVETIVKGFNQASKFAYASVLKPIEGTILTVIRETSEELSSWYENNKKNTNVVEVFKLAKKYAEKSLNNTPNLLPVLKEVGVVDSGGEGFLMIIDGMLLSLQGEMVEINLEDTQQMQFISDTEIYSGEFGYCTELIIKINNVKKFNKDEFIKAAEKLGNSLVVVQDDEILKIHIHTIKPGKVLTFGQKYGEFLTTKIENMTEQANNTKEHVQDMDNKIQPQKEIAIISCNSGDGFINLAKEYECDYVIEGGQSNNPSAKDIIDAIEVVNSKNIIILPNNSNIILAAQQASTIVKDKNVYIIPTKTQVEGITAILNYSSELSVEDNLHEINSALSNLVTGQITQAIKDTKIEGIKIKSGDYLMIKQNKIINTNKNINQAAISLIDDMVKSRKNNEIITIYYGNNVSASDANYIEKHIQKNYNIEVEIHNGDQPIYDFLFGLE